ncbi:MAG: peptidyl-prolyl cis-trans isomerase [Candidatus Omnitrophota bacterium]|nr:peptidyl-prolyl cis-trans isomerase [Candidatus Omnitrophota bacterium]
MKRRIVVMMLLVGVVFGLYACAKKSSDDDRVLVRVSNKLITVKDFKSQIAKIPPYYRNVVEKDKKRYLDEVIVEMLLYEEAVRKGIGSDREIREVINQAKKKIIIAKLIKDEVEDKMNATDDEMRKYYEARKDEFKTPELWRASHILVASEREAKDVLDELAKGAKFEDLASARSTDATASRGGDVGYFRAGQVVPDFENTCIKLSMGQTSEIVRTQFGYHIIKLTDKKEAGLQSYEEAKRSIENELKRKKRNELFSKLVLSLKDKYGVEIKEDVFDSMEKRE